MGTNYYLKTEKCKTCGHKEDGIHLGKSSAGWMFSFQWNGGKYYKNIEEMKAWLKDKKIENEYGEEITPTEFWKQALAKERQKMLNHTIHCKEKYPTMDGNYLIDGQSFTDREFS